MIPNNKKPIERGFEDNQYYIPRETFNEIPNWKPTFNYAHPPLFTEGHRYEPTEAIERHIKHNDWETGIKFVNEGRQVICKSPDGISNHCTNAGPQFIKI